VIARGRLVPALLALLVVAAPLAGGVSATAQPAATPGSVGIGDPYFPDDGNGGIDVLHYDVRDGYRFGSGRLAGRTTLDIRATQNLSRFDLDFSLRVSSVTVDGRRASFHRAGSHELRITPTTPIASGAEFRVAVRYAGVPADQSSQGERNWLASSDEVVTMNEPHMAVWWFPANDHPLDKASFDIRITVPRGKQVIANGVLVAKHRQHGLATTHWRATQPMAPYLAFFAAGSFETHARTCNGIPDYTAVSVGSSDPGHTVTARALADRTCAIVTALATVLGPYPFSAMGGVVTALPASFALENQTRPTYPVVAGPSVPLMAHELAHQWFGDSVSVSSWSDIWLNEGFAQFMQSFYAEATGGRSVQDWLTDTYTTLHGQDGFWKLSIDDPGPARLFDAAVYARGAMALQALRHRIGDPAFWTLLRTWLAQHAYGNGADAEFEALAASVSGQDLSAFFDAWLHATVVPAKSADNGLL